MTEQEMMADLEAADAAGDTSLAQHIAGQIKAARGPMPQAAAPDKSWGTALRKFFDPSYGRPNTNPLADIGRQAAKGLSFAVPGSLLGSRLLAGATAGGLYGAGASDAPDAAGEAGDAAAGAGVGAALTGALGLAGKAAAPAAEYLGAKATKWGRNAISGVSNSLARRKPLDAAAVEQAFKVGAIRPGYNVENIANKLQDAADPLSERYGEILKSLEARGVTGPNASKLAADLLSEGENAANNSIIGTRADALKTAGEKLLAKPTVQPPIGGAANQPIPGAPGGDLGLMQAELMKREVQQAAAGDFVKEGRQSLSGAARKEIAGRMKTAIEDAVSSQAAKAPEEAAAFEPVKNELHLTLQALGQAREGAGRYARRNPFGLHEAMGLASGLATGNPIEAAGSVGLMHALKDRGTSTLASVAHGGAGLARSLSTSGGTVPGWLATDATPKSVAEYLAEALRRYGSGPVPVPAEEAP